MSSWPVPSALDANTRMLPPTQLSRRRRALARDRREIPVSLSSLAAALGIRPSPWLPGSPITPRMLGLDSSAQACIFDLDGVLTDSGALHAAAWAETLDPLLESLAQTTPWALAPVDRTTDYLLYFDGRTRLDGIRLFLESRGLHLS